jgi:hypothetical protein
LHSITLSYCYVKKETKPCFHSSTNTQAPSQPDIEDKIVPLRGDFKAQLLTKFDREEVEIAFGGTLDLSKHPPPQALPYKPISVTSILSAQRARQTREQRNGGDMNNALRHASSGDSDSLHHRHIPHNCEHPKSASNGSILSSAAALSGSKNADVSSSPGKRAQALVINATAGVLLAWGGKLLSSRFLSGTNNSSSSSSPELGSKLVSDKVSLCAAVIAAVALCWSYMSCSRRHDDEAREENDDDDAFAACKGRDAALLKKRLDAEAKGKTLGGWLASCFGVYTRLSMSV